MPTKSIIVSSARLDNEPTPNPPANPGTPSSEQANSAMEEQKTAAVPAKLEAETSAPRSWICLCGDPNCASFHAEKSAVEGAAAAPEAEPATQVPVQLASMAVCAAQLDDESGLSLDLALDADGSGKGPTLLLRRQGTNKMEAAKLSQESAGVKPPAGGGEAPAPAPAAQPEPSGPPGARCACRPARAVQGLDRCCGSLLCRASNWAACARFRARAFTSVSVALSLRLLPTPPSPTSP
jgi:hypothetical protein